MMIHTWVRFSINCIIKGTVNSYGYNAASGGIVGMTTNTDCFEKCDDSDVEHQSGHSYLFGSNNDGSSYGSLDSDLENR